MTETAAERFRRLREDRGVTVAALASEIGVSESAIRQLEIGTVKSPSFAVGLKLSHYFGVDPFYLAFGESSTLDERLLVVERRLTKLEQRVATMPATRR